MIHAGFRSCIPVLIGICLGFTLNVMIAPLLDETCDPSNIDRKQLIKLRETKSLRESEKTSKTIKPAIKPKNYDVPPPPKLENNPHKKPVRPRFVATELGIREKLFVAVLTSQDTVNSFALAVNKTTAHYVTKQMYFSTSKSGNIPAGMPVVSFTDKNKHYLPLHVLKYISEHYSHSYDYYMFITDRTYIRAEKIVELVSHISVSEDIFMGAADFHGEDGSAMCSLEGGIIISQSVLQKVLGNLDWCLVSAPDSNPSRVLNHCVYHSTKTSCTQHGGDKEYRFYKVDDFDYDDDITKLREDWRFNSSFSIYPMPDDLSHFKVHRYFCQLELNLTRQEINKAKENIIHLSHYTVDGVNSLTWPIGRSTH
ncbi:chondroitin sulfate glucuronyltransferase-like [Saccostrea cucullata]|uniref:chondroitin sulfate glucuronyltransferase-like n=1 Tax=Saccostrea cuccullata TaxID=36930 RepID=UPI002ED3EE3C